MKRINTKTVWQMTDDGMKVVEEEFHYVPDDTPIAECKKGGSKTQEVIQKSEPPSYLRPYIERGAQEAWRLYTQPGPEFYPGKTYAGFTPEQKVGQEAALAYAAGVLPQPVNKTLQAHNFAMGDVLYPGSNPALRAYMSEAARPLVANFKEEILPAIESKAVMEGAYSGVRPGLTKAAAAGKLMDSLGLLESGIASKAYGQGLEHQARMTALAPQTLRLGLIPSDVFQQIGAQRQAMNQQAIDEAMARFSHYQNLPYIKLADYVRNVQGVGGGGYGTTISQQPIYRNPAMSALGGGLLGYQLGAALFPELAMAGPIGAGLGILGALFL